MTTRVDDSRSSFRGSYFELLYKKYPDLAPKADLAPQAVRQARRATTSATQTEEAAEQRGFDSWWVPGLLMTLLVLALIFPPALLWQPSWLSASPAIDRSTSASSLPQRGTTTRSAEAPRTVPVIETFQVPGVETSPSKSASSEVASFDRVAPAEAGGPANKEQELAALEAAALEVVRASAHRRQAAARETAHRLRPAAADAAVDGAETAQVSLVAESMAGAAKPEAPLEAASPESPAADMLEVASAGPRIQPAQRLLGEAPRMAAVEQPTRMRLRNHINPQGDVVGVDILQGVSEKDDRRVADALRQWRYEPAKVDGRPVSSQQEVVFVLMPDGAAQLAQAEPIEPARRRVTPLPGYTQEAWIQGTEGEVELLASIDARGDVTDIEVVSGLPHGLTQSAVQAVERWKFDPARQRGEAVASTQRLRLRFAL